MAAEQSGFFARICCCSWNEKEPSVTLIRSQDIQSTPQTSISPAKETVDGTEETTVESPSEVSSGPKEEFRGAGIKWKVTKKEEEIEEKKEQDGMNMNDVMMDDICGEDEDKPCVEDAVSIHTNVIEEVDESELQQMSEILRPAEEIKEEQPVTSRSGEIVSLAQMLEEGYETPQVVEGGPTIEITDCTPRDKKKEEKEYEEMKTMTDEKDDEDSELEEEIIIHESVRPSTPPTASPRSILKTSSTPSTARTEESEKSTDKIESEDDVDYPPPPPLAPPPDEKMIWGITVDNEKEYSGLHHAVMVNVDEEPKKQSMMYAYADSESDSDDDAKVEVLPPVAKPEDDKTDVEEDENWEEKSEKENHQVTRLSVKSNGQASLSTGNVRLALETVDLTDDEFSEKLI